MKSPDPNPVPPDGTGAPGEQEVFNDESSQSPRRAAGDRASAITGSRPSSALMQAGLSYAAMGLPVFPVHAPVMTENAPACSCGKPDCEHIGKHPRTTHGLKDASVDVAVVRAWWTTWPNANIGLVTGAASNTLVFDIDPRNKGDQTLAGLIAVHGELLPTVIAETGGGGRHLFFKHPGEKVKSREVAAGIDCKADGGYIIVSPSLHASGAVYRWSPGLSPSDIQLSDAPPWVLALATAPSRKANAGPTLKAKAGRRIIKSNRNTTLASIGGRLRRGDLDRDAIEAALQAENLARCEPPLGEHEVLRIAESVSRYEPGNVIPYRMSQHGIFFDKPTSHGPAPMVLTNFSATILKDIVEDDGAETIRRFEISGATSGCEPRTVTITSEQFEAMRWHIPLLGCRAVIHPGHSSEAYTRAAIQLLSAGAVSSQVFGHTGWREIDGQWTYLHAGGGINADGLNPHVQVSLSGALSGYVLPAPPSAPIWLPLLRPRSGSPRWALPR